MRYAKLIIGIVLLIKGIKAAIGLPVAISAIHTATGAPGFPAGYAVGEVSGLVIGALAVLVGGVILLANGLARSRDSKSAVSAA